MNIKKYKQPVSEVIVEDIAQRMKDTACNMLVVFSDDIMLVIESENSLDYIEVIGDNNYYDEAPESTSK